MNMTARNFQVRTWAHIAQTLRGRDGSMADQAVETIEACISSGSRPDLNQAARPSAVAQDIGGADQIVGIGFGDAMVRMIDSIVADPACKIDTYDCPPARIYTRRIWLNIARAFENSANPTEAEIYQIVMPVCTTFEATGTWGEMFGHQFPAYQDRAIQAILDESGCLAPIP